MTFSILDSDNVLPVPNILLETSTREQIAIALFKQIQTAGEVFTGYSRRPQLWGDAPDYPYLYMGNTKENLDYSGDNTALNLNDFYYPITIHFKSGLDPTVTPDTELNNLLDAFDAAMAPPPWQQEEQTLGGIVAYARRQGEVIRIPGYLDGQGTVLLTVKVRVP